MSQFDYIKAIAQFGLENDQKNLQLTLNDLIAYFKQCKKINCAIQLQSTLTDFMRQDRISHIIKYSSEIGKNDDLDTNDLILEKVVPVYTFNNLIAPSNIKNELSLFIKEHTASTLLRSFDLPIANKILLHGPSGCGKTLASYAIAGELHKKIAVINLGTIDSSKLGETSKNLAKIFRKAATEGYIIFLDEFDSLGKIRDYYQDHGEMKRVVNTILQLFDFLPQNCIVIAATNQKNMLDEAILRRFEVNLKLELPGKIEITSLVEFTLKKDPLNCH